MKYLPVIVSSAFTVIWFFVLIRVWRRHRRWKRWYREVKAAQDEWRRRLTDLDPQLPEADFSVRIASVNEAEEHTLDLMEKRPRV